MIKAILSDAGVPTSGKTYGMSWAWRHLGDGGIYAPDSLVIAEGFGSAWAHEFGMDEVENNFAETYALLLALEAAPKGWGERCVVASDNQNALGRIFSGWRMRGVPADIEARIRALGKHLTLDGITPVLLQGHPTMKELEAGIGSSGRPVSPHNKWADARCSELAKQLVRSRTAQVVETLSTAG